MTDAETPCSTVVTQREMDSKKPESREVGNQQLLPVAEAQGFLLFLLRCRCGRH